MSNKAMQNIDRDWVGTSVPAGPQNDGDVGPYLSVAYNRTSEFLRLMRNTLPMLFAAAFLVSCAKRIETGPGEVRWDRDVCARCIMAVGDRNYSAQVRGITDDGTQIFFFDDFGCAIHWLSKQTWKDDSRVEVWVNDYRNGEWIDGFTAWYVPGKITPMDYGLGATTEKEDGVIDYEAAVDRILNPDEKGMEHKQGHMHP